MGLRRNLAKNCFTWMPCLRNYWKGVQELRESRQRPLVVSNTHLRGCSHDTRMSFIPEWVSFQNEVRTAFTWQNRPSQTSWKRPFCPPSWKRYACATRPRLHGLRFHLERSSFSVYMIPEWNVIPEREFRSDWKPEWTHSGMTCAGPNFRLGIM